MKTWYLLAAAVAYYLYTQTPAQRLAAAQSAALPSQPGNAAQTIDVTNGLLLATQPVPTYQIPTVMFVPGTGVTN